MVHGWCVMVAAAGMGSRLAVGSGDHRVEKLGDFHPALVDREPLIKEARFGQGFGLIVQLLKLQEEGFHFRCSLWAAEWGLPLCFQL